MARTTKKKNSSSTKSDSADASGSKGIGLKPETIRGIWSVGLFAVALLTLLSLFEFAGVVGEAWRRVLSFFFGLGTLVLPIVLAIGGLLVLRGKQFVHVRARAIGLLAALLATLGLFHVGTATEEMVSAATAGQGGGWLGLLLSLPLKAGFGLWAAVIIIVAVGVIGVLLLLDIGLTRFVPDVMFKRRKTDDEISVRGIGEEEVKESGGLFKKRAVAAADQDGNGSDEADQDEEDDSAENTAEPQEQEPEVTVRNVPDSDSKAPTGPALQVEDMDYTPPSLDLLDSKMARPSAGDIKSNVKKIRQALENFGIPVEMGDVSIGPTVTQYTFKPAEGVKLSAITALQSDLALALAAHPVRIEAPIPGKALVGLEVPNQGVAVVRLREILSSEQYRQSDAPLTLSLGRDVAGTPIVADLAKMPHLLIAGATGSGKSVAINSLLLSLLYKNSPQMLKIILIDPKRVELTSYNTIPHLLAPVVTEPKKTIHALRWAVAEMDKRYELLSASGKRNIASYNKVAVGQKLPYIAIVIDELADLMAVAANDVEAAIVRLAQMARAVGIHLIVATQRPSVDVITGLIKANITSRIAFNVASSIDSRTILDHSGAEKLLGNGDMLYITANLSKPKRIQGAFVTEQEVERVTGELRGQGGEPEYVEAVTDGRAASASGGVTSSGEEDVDDLLKEAKEVVIQNQKASASLLQRRLSVGYARAARLLDLMEERGWIGPGEGAKAREIFIGKESDDSSLDLDAPPVDAPPPSDGDAPPPQAES